MSTEYALEISGLHKEYENGFVALKGIDLKIKKGDFFALLGHNGAGKSTTINIISSLIKKTSGTVRILGHDLDTETETCKSLLGIVPQDSCTHYGKPLLEILIDQAGLYGVAPHDAKIRGLFWLDKMDLLDKVNVTTRELSGGMLRRFMVAKALMHSPKLLILDEPTAGVDVALRHDMWLFLEEINKLGVTIILTTHYLEEAEYLCKHIAIIKSGKIQVNTSMKELITSVQDEFYTLDIEGYTDQKLELEGVKFTLKDDNKTLEVQINRKLSISSCFSYLENHGIVIQSLRNSQNRLERIFMLYNE